MDSSVYVFDVQHIWGYFFCKTQKEVILKNVTVANEPFSSPIFFPFYTHTGLEKRFTLG